MFATLTITGKLYIVLLLAVSIYSIYSLARMNCVFANLSNIQSRLMRETRDCGYVK